MPRCLGDFGLFAMAQSVAMTICLCLAKGLYAGADILIFLLHIHYFLFYDAEMTAQPHC